MKKSWGSFDEINKQILETVTIDETQDEKDKYNVLNELKEVLKLDKMPRKIETYDISNLSGTNMVAGMCVMQDR